MHPRLDITLYNAAKELWPRGKVLAPIDTGYSGGVMLPQQEYQFFMIGELPRRFWIEYTTLAGPLLMKTARAFVRTGDGNELEETRVEAPQLGAGKLLAGRMILKKRGVLLDGPTHISCLMEPQAH
jgi:hypothetical protein